MPARTLAFASCLVLTFDIAASAQPQWVAAAPGSSQTTYLLKHPLHHIEATSTTVAYRVRLDPQQRAILAVTADGDVTSFSSGNSNRDSHAMEVVDALDYPCTQFTSTSVWREGDHCRVAGRLTFHGVTRDVVADAWPAWGDHRLDVHGGFAVRLTDFHIERPALLMIPVEDTLRFTFRALFALP